MALQEIVRRDPEETAGWKLEPEDGQGLPFSKREDNMDSGNPRWEMSDSKSSLQNILEQSFTQMACDCLEENMIIIRS